MNHYTEEKKTICDLCKEVREIIKYIDDPKIKKVEELLYNIQYRAHDMERGLYKSKYEVGEVIYKMLKDNKSDKNYNTEIMQILNNRWKTFVITKCV